MGLRFTGEWPPQKLWVKYPNWEYALDEEDADGQDETTLRPARNQRTIDDDVAYTAGEVEQADGSRIPALIEVNCGEAVGVTVFTKADDGWAVRELGAPPRWVCIVQDWLPEEHRSPTVSFENGSVFPLVVQSRLPLETTGNRLVLKIRSDGTAEIAG
jgi:hypothetical protein